jgi:hypothetical protein
MKKLLLSLLLIITFQFSFAGNNDKINVQDSLKKIEATNYIYQIRVTDIQRLVSSQDNLIHHAISLEVYTKA